MCEGCKWLKQDVNIGFQQYMKCTNPNCSLFGVVVAYGSGMQCSKWEMESVGDTMQLQAKINNAEELVIKQTPDWKLK